MEACLPAEGRKQETFSFALVSPKSFQDDKFHPSGSVLDALADAETLLTVAASFDWQYRALGMPEVYVINGVIPESRPDKAARFARWAAHAAFLAIPSLRG